MKTSVDIPENVLKAAVRYSGAKTKKEAIVTAMQDFVRRKRMAELIKYSGKFDAMPTHEEMKAAERSRRGKLDSIGS